MLLVVIDEKEEDDEDEDEEEEEGMEDMVQEVRTVIKMEVRRIFK